MQSEYLQDANPNSYQLSLKGQNNQPRPIRQTVRSSHNGAGSQPPTKMHNFNLTAPQPDISNYNSAQNQQTQNQRSKSQFKDMNEKRIQKRATFNQSGSLTGSHGQE